MKGVLCIDDKYAADFLAYYKKWGVVVPKKGVTYTVRDAIKHHNGKVGLLLEEIINPKVPINDPLTGDRLAEPTFHIIRFVDLFGNPLNAKEIVAELKKKTESDYVKVEKTPLQEV